MIGVAVRLSPRVVGDKIPPVRARELSVGDVPFLGGCCLFVFHAPNNTPDSRALSSFVATDTKPL